MTNANNASGWWNTISDKEIQCLATIVVKRIGNTMEAVNKANLLERLKKMMSDDIVHFIFNKEAGQERPAYGTRNKNVISRYSPPGTQQQPQRSQSTFVYFDIVKKAWRSFRPENLVIIDENYTL